MIKPIRILNIIGRMDRGGIETLIMNIYRNIDRTRIQFDFLAHYNKPSADYNEEIKRLGGMIYEMPQIKTEKSAKYHMILKYRKALKHFFKEHQEYKVIHLHMTNTASIIIPIAKKHGNVKVIIAHSHLTRAKEGFVGFVTNTLQKNIEKNSSDYFACSKDAAHWFFSKKTIDSGKVKILNNGIDTDKFKFDMDVRIKLRKKLELENSFVIGHVGRFYPQKNHEFIIRTFDLLSKVNDKAKLMLIGEGVLRGQYEKMVISLGLKDKVLFMGNRDDVHDLMQAMDVFFMPSLFEGLPLVGIEAQAAGLPCVFSDTITKEVELSEDVTFLKLDQSKEDWVKSLLKHTNFCRSDQQELIRKKGYDIKTISNEMQNYYLGKYNDL